MKIALVIFRLGPSHGSILQTFALTRTLEKLGHEVTIIDRQKPIDYFSASITIFKRFGSKILGRHKGPFFYFGEYSPQVMSNLDVFVNEELKKRRFLRVRTERQLSKIVNQNYEVYIIGSDQVWRPKFVYDIYYYYLNFLPSSDRAKRIAYAPSFGVDFWEYTEEQTKKCKELAQLFNAISVREYTGVNLCEKYLGVSAVHVIDPTMLLQQNDYEMLIHQIDNTKENYIAYSVLDDTEKTKEILHKVSNKLRLPLKRINRDPKSLDKKERYIEPGIESWLSGIRNASFVVTDSFHATVFSIIFNKPFVVIMNEKRGSARILSLLNIFGLDNRIVKSSEEEIDTNIAIDWGIINSIKKEWQMKSFEFLEEALSKAKWGK